jgi:2-hydroxy-3-keto-5-methylthiopentenyl-1-phosphate phosphatase
MKKEFKIFIDFDGTITTTDVGEAIFRQFGNSEKVNKIIEDLLNDKISARDSWIELCSSVESITKKELDDFIDQIEIDSTFTDFISFCSENKIDHYILSDGFDYYLKRILARENIDTEYFANALSVLDNKLIPSFPFLDFEFASSANCKRNHIINNSSDDDYTVFIGDGNSDKYTVQYCDFVFAKDDLLKFCEKERISYFPFNNFDDVKQIMIKLFAKKRLKKRHQAELKRREAYIQE